MIPTVISDNFFPNPDKIVDFALSQEYFPDDSGRSPGKRTHQLYKLDSDLFEYTINKILEVVSLEHSDCWEFDCGFQLIEPYTKDKYDPKNKGWVHNDKPTLFGGIVYLNKNPEEDTGTSIYDLKNGYPVERGKFEVKKYKNVATKEFEDTQHAINSQYVETISIKNVYNRLVMFSGNTYHAAQTFGNQKNRLTMPFFCRKLTVNKTIFFL